MLERILLQFPEESFLKMDGLDEAVIGYDLHSMKLIYSVRAIKSILMERDDMDEIDAIEFIDFNIRSTYMGSQTPILCEDDL